MSTNCVKKDVWLSSRPWQGSSRISMGGLFTSARASNANRCCPSESRDNMWLRKCSIPRYFIHSITIDSWFLLTGRNKPIVSKKPEAIAWKLVAAGSKYKCSSGEIKPIFCFMSQMLSPDPLLWPKRDLHSHRPGGYLP